MFFKKKSFLNVLTIFFSIIFILSGTSLVLEGKFLKTKKKFSIFGNQKESVFSTLISSETYKPEKNKPENIAISSSAAVVDMRSDTMQSTAAVTVSTFSAVLTSTASAIITSTAAQTTQIVEPIPYETPQIKAGAELVSYLEDKKILNYSKDRWNKMRNKKEGYVPDEDKISDSQVAVSTAAKPALEPLPPGLTVELPYESQLSISGRKLIGVSYKSIIYDKEESLTRKNTGSFDMQQELQVKIKGRVGRKINVNVDFDDTKDDKRDISVVYKGDPDEVVQEAAFGDIAMALPSTEFAGYSKQLFGVKLDTKLQPKGKDLQLRTQGFFSRTKGFSEIKRFTGNTEFKRTIISDTSYIRYKYYKIRFNDDAIINGTVRVLRDDRNPTNNNITTSTNVVVETFGTTPDKYTKYTGDFDLLVPGQDYTVDYNRGIIVFKTRMDVNYVVAVDYQRADKTWLSSQGILQCPKIIKEETNDNYKSRELKTFYNLDSVKIIRDNGRGNFILKIVDLNDKDVLTDVPKYPDNISVDFENGIMNFEPPDVNPFPEELYSRGTTKYKILTEYRRRIKFVSLGKIGIVPQSERVTMNGKVLKQNEDYFIDYDAGIVTFLNEEKITESTVIEVSYDYAPFGSSGGSTLIGLRSELSLTKNIFIGSSFIYDFSAKGQSVPDIRTTPSSLMVVEGDSRIQDIQIPFTDMKVSVSGEYAKSQRNPNIMDKAIIESMEGIKQEESCSISWDAWKIGSNPAGRKFYIKTIDRSDGKNPITGDISWNSEEVRSKDINPNLQIKNENETQQVLSVDYNLGRSDELSLIQSLSNIGLDYSKKIYMEMWMYGDNNGETFSISYGQFNENVDSDNPSLPKTEDLNHDGTLNSGEDIGWPFVNPDGTITMIGKGNGRIDSEDLDNNGVMNRFDFIANPGPYGVTVGRSIVDSDGVVHTNVDWRGWKYFKIPLNITQPDDWKTIKHIRLTIGGHAGQSGNIKVASISLTSNKWEPIAVAGSSVTVAAINNETDPEYAQKSLISNPEYQSLYELQDSDLSQKREQALSLTYTTNNSSSTDASARLLYDKRPYDFTNYRRFRLFVYNKSADASDTFFIQAGNDTNYFEYSLPISWTGWKLITIFQYDLNNDNKPEMWAVNDKGEKEDITGVKTKSVGQPSLQNISQLKVGVRTVSPKSGEIWVNEIHVMESIIKEGVAWRGNVDFKLPGWTTFGMKRKEINRNFESFSAGIYNRDSLEDGAYFTFDKIQRLPLNFKIDRTRTVTPSVVQTQNDLVSVLDEGRVINYTGSGNASFDPGKYLPKFSYQYARAVTDSQDMKKLEDKQTTSGNFTYDNPINFMLLPKSISANYSITDSYYKVYPSTKISDNDNFLDIETAKKYIEIVDFKTLEISETWGCKTPFQFGSLFNFTPSYSLTTVKEKNKTFTRELIYPKSLNQDAGINSTLRLLSWFAPNMTYNINTKENYNLNYNTSTAIPTYPSQTKYIERNSSGEISWNFQVKDLTKFKFVQSLSFYSSYRIQDSDSYDNVVSTVSVLGTDKLWIRKTPLMQELAPGTTGSYIIKSIVKKDDIRISSRYNPFEAFNISGRLSPVKTFSTNVTYTRNEEDSNILSTRKIVYTNIWPDLLLGLNQIEKMVWLDRWLSDSTLNLKHQYKTTETVEISKNINVNYGAEFRFNLIKKLDLSFSANTSKMHEREFNQNLITKEGLTNAWAAQSGFNFHQWRFTVRYENNINKEKDGLGKYTSDLLTDTYTAQIYSDISFPRGLPIPFTRRTLPLTNRIIFNSSLKYLVRSSSMNVDKDNTNNYGLSMSGEYEISQNFRLSIGIAWNRLENRTKADESYTSIEGSSRLTIQF